MRPAPWFVVALVFSLAGDVFLMLPNEDLFVPGLGSFLVGHVAYIVGLLVAGISPLALVVGVVVVAVLIAVARAAARDGRPATGSATRRCRCSSTSSRSR